jgi:ABC-type multidrug transport system fused ATPase/permease subunit
VGLVSEVEDPQAEVASLKGKVVERDQAAAANELMLAVLHVGSTPINMLALISLLWYYCGFMVVALVTGCAAPLVWISLRFLQDTVKPYMVYANSNRNRVTLVQRLIENIYAIKGDALEKTLSQKLADVRMEEMTSLMTVHNSGLRAAFVMSMWPRFLTVLLLGGCSMISLRVHLVSSIICLQIFCYLVHSTSTLVRSIGKLSRTQQALDYAMSLASRPKNLTSQQVVEAPLASDHRDFQLPEGRLNHNYSNPSDNTGLACSRLVSLQHARGSGALHPTMSAVSNGIRQFDLWDSVQVFISLAGGVRICVCIGLLFLARLAELLADLCFVSWAHGGEFARLAWPTSFTLCLVGIALSLSAIAVGTQCFLRFSTLVHSTFVVAPLLTATADHISGIKGSAQFLKRLTQDLAMVDLQLWPRFVGLSAMFACALSPLAYGKTVFGLKFGGLRTLGFPFDFEWALLLGSLLPGMLSIIIHLLYLRDRTLCEEVKAQPLSLCLTGCASVAYALAAIEIILRPTGFHNNLPSGCWLVLLLLALLPQTMEALLEYWGDFASSLESLSKLQALIAALEHESDQQTLIGGEWMCATVAFDCSSFGSLLFDDGSRGNTAAKSIIERAQVSVYETGEILFEATEDMTALVVMRTSPFFDIALRAASGISGSSSSICAGMDSLYVVAVNGLGAGSAPELAEELCATVGNAMLSVRCGWLKNGATLETRDLQVRYRKSLAPAFKSVSISLQACEHLAVVGAAGTGKSALFLSLVRILEIESGAAWLGGRDLRSISLSDLRMAVTLVSQEPLLFGLGVRASLDPSGEYEDTHLLHLAQRLKMSDIIELGWNRAQDSQQVSSGALARRIALGRAVLRQSPLVLIDQALCQRSEIQYGDDQFTRIVRGAMPCSTVLQIIPSGSAEMDLTGFTKVLKFLHGGLVESCDLL